MHLHPLTRIFLLWWLSSYFPQQIIPGQSPRNATTTQHVPPLCSHSILHIWLHLPQSTVSTCFMSVVPTRISTNVELKLDSSFLLKCDQPSAFLNLTLLLSWSLIPSTTDLLEEMWKSSQQWVTSWRTLSSGTEVTLPLPWMGGYGKQSTSWTQPSVQHLRQDYPMSWSFFICLSLVLFCTVCFCPIRAPKELNSPWLVLANKLLNLLRAPTRFSPTWDLVQNNNPSLWANRGETWRVKLALPELYVQTAEEWLTERVSWCC